MFYSNRKKPLLFFLYDLFLQYKLFLWNIVLRKKPPIERNIMDESYSYVNKESRKFLSKIIHSDWNKNQDKNKNISNLCYSDSLHEILETEKGKELEEEWKRRILLENTPRGNIVMYYDIYKRAFVYASDQNIPYPILNVCAMKYVIVFRCFDFFIDSTVLPKEMVSPFVKNIEDSEKKEKEVKEVKEIKEKKRKKRKKRKRSYTGIKRGEKRKKEGKCKEKNKNK